MRDVDTYRAPELVDRGSLERLTKDSEVGTKPEGEDTTVVWGTPPPVTQDDGTEKPVV